VAFMNHSLIGGIAVAALAVTASIILIAYSMKIIRKINTKKLSSLREIERELWGGR